MISDTIKKETIRFPNHNAATFILPSAQSQAEDIVDALALPAYNALILIIGGADNIDKELIPKLTQLFSRGIARAAAKANAAIIDGGTQSGVMSLMGEGVASRGYKSILIGVAPKGLVEYPGSTVKGTSLEPNHSHFVLVEGNTWGAETAMLFNIVNKLRVKPAETAANAHQNKQDVAMPDSKLPAVTILVGGGKVSKTEVLRAVRQNITLIVAEGSGGLADEIFSAWQNKATLPDDPVMAEIIADGKIHFHSLNNSVACMEGLIAREFDVDKVLMQAWETFSDYDYNAIEQERIFDWLQKLIIAIGVIGTALVVVEQVWAPRAQSDPNGPYDLLKSSELFQHKFYAWWIVNHLVILIPILLTILVTAVARFKQGTKWLLLRAGAESIKREIYRYRSRALDYTTNAEQQLSLKLEDITRRTMRTEVNLSALKPYNKGKGFPPYMYAAQGGDDGFSFLSPDRYVEVRLTDQYNYYKKKAITYEKQLKSFYWLTFIIGGLGTYLAAIEKQAWIALTTSLVAAIGTYLGYRQTESTLIKYNQAATDLSNINLWWNALPTEDQAKQENIDSLVQHTEQVLQSELSGWIQQMQNALAELRKNQEQKPEKEESKGPEGAASRSDTKKVSAETDNDGNASGIKKDEIISGTDNEESEPMEEPRENTEQPVSNAEKEILEAKKEATATVDY